MAHTKYAPHLFAEELTRRIREKGLSIRTFAEFFDMTYEHSRKLIRGESFPSKFLLKEICARLDLNFEAMEKKLVSDKIRKQHGTIPLELAGKDPRFENFEHVLMKLSPLQVEELYVLAQVLARRNEFGNKHTPCD